MKKLDIARTFSEYGLKAKDVAERLGITSMAISSRINRNPTVSSLEEIAEAVGCDITDFFYPEDTAAAPADGLFAQQVEGQSSQDAAQTASSPDVKADAEGAKSAQDAREMMYCPHCGTKFFVVNVPTTNG